jgi:hypothetical protein
MYMRERERVMSDYRYEIDPIFDDNSDNWIACKACDREYDRKEYKSDTCDECESQPTNKQEREGE